MKATCDACHTIYDLPPGQEGKQGCPFCEHVNAPAGGAAKKAAAAVASPGSDHVQTMVAPVDAPWAEETSRSRRAVSGKMLDLPANLVLSLLVAEGDQKGKSFPITKSKITIGRKQSEIVLNDPEVSRRHCSIFVFGDLVVVRDLGSVNGTLVNNRIIKENLLKSGDTLQVGGTVMKFSVQPKS